VSEDHRSPGGGHGTEIGRVKLSDGAVQQLQNETHFLPLAGKELGVDIIIVFITIIIKMFSILENQAQKLLDDRVGWKLKKSFWYNTEDILFTRNTLTQNIERVVRPHKKIQIVFEKGVAVPHDAFHGEEHQRVGHLGLIEPHLVDVVDEVSALLVTAKR